MNKSCVFLVVVLIYAVVGQVVIPPEVTINCSGSTHPSSTGYATIDGENQFYAESVLIDNSCQYRFNRYWRDINDNDLGTQTITIQRALPPVVSQNPQGVSYACDGTGANINNVINNDIGNAIFSEPCGTTIAVSNDYVAPNPNQCYWSAAVTYTFTNLCGEQVTRTANYATIDAIPPTFTTLPQDATVSCSADRHTQFQDWLTNGGGATLTSICLGTDGLSFLHDYNGGNVACGESYTVNFRSTDMCGQSGSTSHAATFFVSPPALPTRQDLAEEISLDYENTISNDYESTFELPADWDADWIINPLWYHISAVNFERSIIASTCSTPVDTVLGIYVPAFDGTLSGAFNDDRVPNDSCDSLSSYVQFTVPAFSDFYVVVGSYDAGGDIDLHIYQEAATCEQLITEARDTIVSTLSSNIYDSASNLSWQIYGVNDQVTQLNNEVNNGLSNVNLNLFDQFSQVQLNLAQVNSELSSSITNSEAALSAQVYGVSDSLTVVAAELQIVRATAETTAASVSDLAVHLNDVPSSLTGIAAQLENVASYQLPDVSNNLNTLAANTQSSFDVMTNNLNAGFEGVDSSLSQITTQTSSLLTDVNAVNTLATQIKSYLETVNFERYLISNATDISNVPWQYRTPASYMGKMDDLLNYAIQTYNTKLSSCVGSSSTGCVWFRSSTATPFSTLVSNYNTHVNAQRFKKAFDVIQSFYLKMFPTTLFV